MKNSASGTQSASSKDSQDSPVIDTHELLMKVLKNPEIIKERLQNFIQGEKEVFGDSIEEISSLGNYLIANWRSLVPPLVAFGLSVILKQTESIEVGSKTVSKNSMQKRNSRESLLN